MSPTPSSPSVCRASPVLVRLAAGLLSLMLLVVTLAALALHQSRIQYEERAQVATRNLAELLGQDIAATFDKADLAVLAVRDEIEQQLATEGIDPKKLYSHIAGQHARQTTISSLGVTDAKGNFIFGSGIDSNIPSDIAERAYFQRLRDDAKAELIFSRPLAGRNNGEPLIVLARRIDNPDNSFYGTVYATLPLAYFRQRFSGLDLGTNGLVSLRNAELASVIRYPEKKNTEGGSEHPVPSSWHENLKANPVTDTVNDQQKRVLSYHKVGNYPFYIVVGQLPDDFLMEWRQEAVRTLILVAIFLAVTTAFLLLMRRAWKRHEADGTRMAELSRRLIAMQESERRQLALELHDVVSPNLAALRLNLGTMLTELPPQTVQRFGERLSDVQALLDDTVVSLREVCANLRPAMLDYSGLLPALKDYAAHFSRGASVSVTVSGEESAQRLAPDVESLLFRIAQEAVTNSVKHAHARSIAVELAQQARWVRLTITDDGRGFEQDKLGKDGHHPGLGLITMRERAEFAGGRLDIESGIGRGTRVTVEIPAAD